MADSLHNLQRNTADSQPLAADLPESLAEVLEAIGLAATLKLVERFGGIRLSIPRPEHIDEQHTIARAIGLAAAQKLGKIWANERPALPRCVDALRRARDRAIRADYRQLSASQLALKYQLTERQVYSIVASEDPPVDQARLF